VGADTAIAVTVEGRGVAAVPAVTLTGDEIDERRFLGLLQLVPLSELGAGVGGAARGFGSGILTDPWARGVSPEYRPSIPYGQEGEPEVSRFGPIVR
jgi:hypothetical protein